MKGAKRLYRLAMLSGILLLAACGTVVEHDAGFAPAFPVAAEAPQQTSGAIYQAGFSRNMFEDSRARSVGDLLTVTLTESTNAQKKASTTTAKDSTISLGVPTIFGAPVVHNGDDILSASGSNGNEFSGDGASAQSNSLTGSITVFVANVMPNGNLVIRGEKRMTLNTGDEYIRLSGIVRPEDIAPDNTIDSTKVANAEILYSGNGAVADSNRQGWLGRFFNSPLWPF